MDSARMGAMKVAVAAGGRLILFFLFFILAALGSLGAGSERH